MAISRLTDPPSFWISALWPRLATAIGKIARRKKKPSALNQPAITQVMLKQVFREGNDATSSQPCHCGPLQDKVQQPNLQAH